MPTKPRQKAFLAAATIGVTIVAQSASAAISIGFEPGEGYAAGAFVNATVNSSNTAHPFTGNVQGWSTGTSTNTGTVIATTTSGDYVGGQAISTTTNGNGASYIGAIDLGLNGFTSITFDVGTQPGATVGQASAYVGGYHDANDDSQFTQNAEIGPSGGIINGQLGIRAANYGSSSLSGVSATAGEFYRITVGLDFSTNTITLDAVNLSQGSVAVDLNGVAEGNTFSVTDAAYFAGVNPSDYAGVVARVSGFGVVDNINVVPEPAAAVLGGLGALMMLRRRRA